MPLVQSNFEKKITDALYFPKWDQAIHNKRDHHLLPRDCGISPKTLWKLAVDISNYGKINYRDGTIIPEPKAINPGTQS